MSKYTKIKTNTIFEHIQNAHRAVRARVPENAAMTSKSPSCWRSCQIAHIDLKSSRAYSYLMPPVANREPIDPLASETALCATKGPWPTRQMKLISPRQTKKSRNGAKHNTSVQFNAK